MQKAFKLYPVFLAVKKQNSGRKTYDSVSKRYLQMWSVWWKDIILQTAWCLFTYRVDNAMKYVLGNPSKQEDLFVIP